MGIKLVNLHIFPWCFQLMGHRFPCVQDQHQDRPAPTIKLINSDGKVTVYNRPVRVSELMMQFPKHLVCSSDSLYIGQKIPSLSQNDRLQLGRNYFLLPKHCFQSVLSFVTIASFTSQSSSQALRNSRTALVKKAATCQPFDIQKSPSGCLRIRVSDEFIIWQLMEQGKLSESEEEKDNNSTRSRVCSTPQLRRDYSQLVGSQRWKPKLETIKEKGKKRKLSSFGMKKKKHLSKATQKAQVTQKTHNKITWEHQHQASSIKPSSKSKIKTTIKSRK
ncbi:hypothetical protein K2173_010068 [Erythroxylum novogranatense]|uniref:Uncharacterized protein n=1 Tax=Erythroxylum novogranatense TaxID=1862640 RepID=A0AAV8SZM6_9ROSI|nr:hypothetical protein K2173_010068 [Erythroxylum novogranatense]